tara:strand:+ start:2411 stop:2650 length:240 start_codon:yes stop_codon:yes gene_type:complete
MGRAIEVDNRLDRLEKNVNELFLILEELSNINTTQEHIDLHEETKEETNVKGSADGDGKSNKGKSTSKAKPSKNTGSSK